MHQHHGPAWEGFHIDGDTLTTDNGETYTPHDLRFLRWERNNYAAAARALQNQAERTGTAEAIWISEPEWKLLREAVRLLDARLGGAVRHAA